MTGTPAEQIHDSILSQRPSSTYALYTFLIRCWRAGNTLPTSLEVDETRIDELLFREEQSVTESSINNETRLNAMFKLPKIDDTDTAKTQQADNRLEKLTFREMLTMLSQQQGTPLQIQTKTKCHQTEFDGER